MQAKFSRVAASLSLSLLHHPPRYVTEPVIRLWDRPADALFRIFRSRGNSIIVDRPRNRELQQRVASLRRNTSHGKALLRIRFQVGNTWIGHSQTKELGTAGKSQPSHNARLFPRIDAPDHSPALSFSLEEHGSIDGGIIS